MVNNGKYINGGAVYNPFGVVNDGLIDISWVHDPSYQGYWGMSGLMKKAQNWGGIQAFDGHQTFMRGRNITITDPSDSAHTINIDNEELTFRNTLKLDTHDSSDQKYSVDIFVDTDNYFT